MRKVSQVASDSSTAAERRARRRGGGGGGRGGGARPRGGGGGGPGGPRPPGLLRWGGGTGPACGRFFVGRGERSGSVEKKVRLKKPESRALGLLQPGPANSGVFTPPTAAPRWPSAGPGRGDQRRGLCPGGRSGKCAAASDCRS